MIRGKNRSSNLKPPLSDANFLIEYYLINEIELFEMERATDEG